MNSDRERRDSRDIRLQRRAAPTHAAHAAVARSCMMMSVNPPPPPSPSAGARSAPCTKRLESSATGLPHTGARGRAARSAPMPSALPSAPGAKRARSALAAPSAERGARDGDQARCTRPGAQSARAIGAESAQRSARRRGAARWQSPGARRCPTVHSVERALCDLIRHDGTTGRLLPASVTPSLTLFFRKDTRRSIHRDRPCPPSPPPSPPAQSATSRE